MNVFLLGLALGVSAHSNHVQAEPNTFTWERVKTVIKPKARIQFDNGTALAGNGKDKAPNLKIIAHNKKTKRTEVVVENDSTYIAAAYPSATNAKVAIVGQTCLKEECKAQDLRFVVPEGDFVKSYSIEDAQTVEVKFDENGQLEAKAQGISMGVDGYGGSIEETLVFKPGMGFTSPNLSDAYAALIGQHPEKFLARENLREPLLASMGREKFKDFRESLRVSSGTRLMRGKFLFMQGCQAHNCAENFAVLLIDGVTGEMWWGLLKENNFDQAFGSTMQNNRRIERIGEIGNLLDNNALDHENYTLIVNEEGFVQISSVER